MARRYTDDPSNLDRGFRERTNDGPAPGEGEKKSWREKDRGKDKSAHRQDNTAKHERADRPESQAYRSYKSQLDKLFDGGAVPDALKEKMEAAGIGKDKKARKEAATAILEAVAPRKKLKALKDYEDAHGFPTDEQILINLLELDDEPSMVARALDGLAALLDEGALKKASSLRARLKTVKMMVDDDDVSDKADELLDRL